MAVVGMARARHGGTQRQMFREALHGRIRVRQIVKRIDVMRSDMRSERTGGNGRRRPDLAGGGGHCRWRCCLLRGLLPGDLYGLFCGRLPGGLVGWLHG